MYDTPVFRAMGERGLLVELGERIAPDINAGVHLLLCGLSQAPPAGVVDLVPGYRSLLVVFDPLILEVGRLKAHIQALWERRERIRLPAVRTHEVPVVYGGDRGPDLQWVADFHGIDPNAVADLHSSVTYRVYMIGFTPGYPYLGELPPELDTPRRATPRTCVPKGSVGIAQRQTGIYPADSPGGWQIIGWTPIELFDPRSNPPARMQIGDRVRFRPITAEEEASWRQASWRS